MITLPPLRRLPAILGLLTLAGGVAHARHLGLRAQGRMSARGVAEGAVRLVPGVAGWYLTLDVPADASTCRAELRDVSPLPGPLLKWVEEVPNFAATTTLLLDPQRYLGSHTYRLSLRCGLREIAGGLVHLQSPVDPGLLRRFDLERRAAASERTEIAIVPKGAL